MLLLVFENVGTELSSREGDTPLLPSDLSISIRAFQINTPGKPQIYPREDLRYGIIKKEQMVYIHFQFSYLGR
jgi:hypothetical protein